MTHAWFICSLKNKNTQQYFKKRKFVPKNQYSMLFDFDQTAS